MAYGLQKDFAGLCFEMEEVDGTDPANIRHIWPGKVLSISDNIDRLHRKQHTLGFGEMPDIMFERGTAFEIEVESFLSEVFDLASLLQTMEGRVLGNITHGVITGGPYTANEFIDGGTSSAVAIMVTSNANDMDFYMVQGAFQNGEVLTGRTSGATATTTATATIPTGDATNLCPRPSFTMECGFNTTTIAAAYKSWNGCKLAEFSLTLRPDEPNIARFRILARHFNRATAEIDCATTDLSELTLPAGAPSKWAHNTFTWEDGSGASLTSDPDVREFDLTINNDLQADKTDTGDGDVAYFQEGNREITFAINTLRQSNEITTIYDADPAVAAGQLHLQLVISQSGGFYMAFDFGVVNSMRVNLQEEEEPKDRGEVRITQNYAGEVIGNLASGEFMIDFTA